MKLLLLLSSILFSQIIFAIEQVDFSCHVDQCKIPHNKDGYKDGLEVCFKDTDLKEKMKEVTWSEGKREGPAHCYKNGKLSIEAEYKGDELNGLFAQHNYDSRGSRVRVLKNGVAHGYDFTVDSSGKVTDINWCYQDGRADSAELTSCMHENYGKYLRPINEYKAQVEKKQKLDAAKLAKRMNGPQTLTYATGKPRSTYTNVNGKMTGLYKAFTEDGQVTQECHFKDDYKDGVCTDYDSAGRIDLKAVFKVGEILSSEKFFDNGKVEEKLTHEAGSKIYCYIIFYDSGLKSTEYCQSRTKYEWRGEYEGTYTGWSMDGKKYVTGKYEKGREIGIWERYDEDGSISVRSTYEKGILLKSVEFLYFKYENNIQRPFLHRLEKEFFPDGSLKKETEYPGHDGAEKVKVI